MNFVVWNTIPLLLIAISSTSINGFSSLPNNRSPLQSSSFSSVDDVGNTKWMQSIRSSSTARTLPTTTRSNRRTIHINLSLRNNNENDNDSPSPSTTTTTNRLGLKVSAGSIGAATAAALLLFINGGGSFDIPQAQAATTTPGGEPSFVVAKATPDPKVQLTNVPPPPITATSTPQAITIAKTLQSLDAKMYGAYWCSHCNEQKQTLGREAMSYVTYVECAKDGKDSQAAMCKKAGVPGFPTWDIGGKLYPGEWGLDELEDILKEVNGRIAKGKM